jgi:pSer/pThr/pTyr-binding forkhead associated (FHA) protein
MICAWCKSDIDNDSFHCDQCGKELLVCPVCNKPGKGKSCIEDGSPLFSPKQKANGGTQAPASASQPVSLFSPAPPQAPGTPLVAPPVMQQAPPPPVQQQVFQSPVQQPLPGFPALIPGLRLVNKSLNIEIDMKDGGIIGRAGGDFVSTFSQFSQVSSRHMQFVFDKLQGWTIIDLGSTNGVALSNQPNWSQVPKLSPNTPVAIKENTFLLVANIEFQLKVIPVPSPNSGTVRL